MQFVQDCYVLTRLYLFLDGRSVYIVRHLVVNIQCLLEGLFVLLLPPPLHLHSCNLLWAQR